MSGNINKSFKTNQVVVGTTATLIVAKQAGRDTVVVENHGTTNVFIGNSSALTTSTGLLLPGVVGASIAIETTDDIYGIVGTGTQAVSYVVNF